MPAPIVTRSMTNESSGDLYAQKGQKCSLTCGLELRTPPYHEEKCRSLGGFVPGTPHHEVECLPNLAKFAHDSANQIHLPILKDQSALLFDTLTVRCEKLATATSESKIVKCSGLQKSKKETKSSLLAPVTDKHRCVGCEELSKRVGILESNTNRLTDIISVLLKHSKMESCVKEETTQPPRSPKRPRKRIRTISPDLSPGICVSHFSTLTIQDEILTPTSPTYHNSYLPSVTTKGPAKTSKEGSSLILEDECATLLPSQDRSDRGPEDKPVSGYASAASNALNDELREHNLTEITVPSNGTTKTRAQDSTLILEDVCETLLPSKDSSDMVPKEKPGTIGTEVHAGEASTSARPISQQMPQAKGGLINRKRNIVIKGVPESTAGTPKERWTHDMNLIHTYVDCVLQDEGTIRVNKAFRLGKAEPSRDISSSPRPLKVVLDNDDQAALLLGRRMALKNSHKTVFFQPDYEPKERMKMRELRSAMKERMDGGEIGLKIKDWKIIEMKKSHLWQIPVTMKARSPQSDQQ